MCNLVVQFRSKAEPTWFPVPHDRMDLVPFILGDVAEAVRRGPVIGVPLDGYAPLTLNAAELEYLLLQPCESYVAEVRRAAIVAAAQEPKKELPQ